MSREALFSLVVLTTQYYWLLIQPVQCTNLEDMNNVSKTWSNSTQINRANQINATLDVDIKLIIVSFRSCAAAVVNVVARTDFVE
ncbi:hypothetical protein PHET_00082 [Paragonimus heterotremus]|uniref:Secreted protein n=1 Tax=Paragonimus heterotremus TaxID=100268 RepID=A0A8J4T5E7_9TREM|nr:hypothetical protein PHET_00082 [Paragonimus heterotremus]